MTSRWFEFTIADVAKVMTGKTPPGTLDKYFSGDTLFITPTDMSDEKCITSTLRTLSNAGVEQQKKIIFDRGIVVSCIGWQMGKSAIVKQQASANQQINIVIPDESIIDLDFLYYVLSSKRQEIFNLGATATRTPILKKSLFERISFKTPSLVIQKRISECLSNLDYKIQLNRQTNKTLEQFAQAIFKSWFVDFEPTRAKIAARERWLALHEVIETSSPTCYSAEFDSANQPTQTLEEAMTQAAMAAISGKTPEELEQLSPEQQQNLRNIAALFPDTFVDSELGEIPEGWEPTTFGKVSKCFDSKRVPLSKSQRESKKPGDIPYYGATSVMDYVNDWLFDDVYLLLGEDGSVIHEDGTPFTQYIWGKSWVNNHAHVLQGANGVSTEQLMLFAQCQNFSPYITGAVQLKLNQGNMNSIPFVDAGSLLNGAFFESISPLYQKIRSTIEQTKNLELLRDTLLPKLLSGELNLTSSTEDAEVPC